VTLNSTLLSTERQQTLLVSGVLLARDIRQKALETGCADFTEFLVGAVVAKDLLHKMTELIEADSGLQGFPLETDLYDQLPLNQTFLTYRSDVRSNHSVLGDQDESSGRYAFIERVILLNQDWADWNNLTNIEAFYLMDAAIATINLSLMEIGALPSREDVSEALKVPSKQQRKEAEGFELGKLLSRRMRARQVQQVA